MELRILKTENELNQAQKLYQESFDDPVEFAQYFYNEYNNNCTHYGVFENDQLIYMTTITTKRIQHKEEQLKANYIVAVATKKEFQKQGIMKKYLPEILSYYSKYEPMFIQSRNWDYYDLLDFKPCTIRSQWFLRQDQILHNKKELPYEEINFDIINDIRNHFNNIQGFESFSYRTKKENKKWLKMHLLGGDKIYHTKNAYIIIADGYVIDYGFIELIDLIKLLSNFEFGLLINSIIPLDKRYFTQKPDSEYIETKSNIGDANINFSEFF